MEVFLIKAAQLILSLSILIVLHELGHFIPAKLFKTRVEKFYLFFDPWFSLFKIKKGETEYGLGWLPLGGYVKISGMIDESMDKEQMKEEPKPWEFRSKPAWQRLIIMIGGVTVNLILGFLIYSTVLFAYGKEKLPISNLKYGVHVDSVMTPYGFQNGDKLVDVGNGSVKYFEEIGKAILIHDVRDFKVNRDGEIIDITLPDSIDQVMLANETRAPFEVAYQFVVGKTQEGTEAERIGLESGDRFVTIAGDSVNNIYHGMELIRANKGQKIDLVMERKGDLIELKGTVSEEGRLGFMPLALAGLETETYEYTFLESIPAGFNETKDILGGYISSLSLIFTKEGASSVGGFGTIGSLFPATWSWRAFWQLTAFLSLILAFMNILPIPALDGGHVMFLLYEIVSGRKPGDKFLENAQMVGMFLLLGLLIFANGNDVYKLVLSLME